MARIVYTDISGQECSVPFGSGHPVVSVGRATDCTIRSNRKSVSRRHAEFRFTNGQFEIMDLNSSNGTYLIINGERRSVVGREYLAPDDEVWCGDFILHFSQESEDDLPTQSGGQAGSQFQANPYQSDPYQAEPYQQPAEEPFADAAANPYNAGQANFDRNQGAYDQPNSYDQPNAYDQPNSFDQPNAYEQPNSFDQPNPYEQQNSYDQPNAFDTGNDPANVAWGQTEPPASQASEVSDQPEQMERLRAEKAAIEDLAARQAEEIEEAQSRLEQERRLVNELRGEVDSLAAAAASSGMESGEVSRLREEIDAGREEKKRLEERLHTALQEGDRASQMEAELAQTRDRASFLENELEGAITRTEELEAQLLAGASTQETNQRLQENVLAKNRDIEALESEVERLQQELDASIRKGREASQEAENNSKAAEETDALRREVDRHSRLVEEFERRNRDLQAEVDSVDQRIAAHVKAANTYEARVDDLEIEVASARRESDTLREERDEQSRAMEDLLAQGDVKDLRNEIEGLKERLRLAKDRSRNEEHLEEENRELKEKSQATAARVEELEGEMDVLRQQIDAAGQPPEPGAAVSGLSPEVLVQLVDRVDALDRIVDAIVRADLDPLSTVDRVRLQSAIRDTEPKKSLTALKALLTSDQSE